MKRLVFASLLACASALPLFAQSPAACKLTTSNGKTLRASGITERVADLVLTCEGSSGGTANVSFDLSFNTEVTNRSYEPILLIGEPDPLGTPPTPLVPGTNLFQASVVAGNKVQFQNIPVPLPESGKKVVLRFSNLRVNAASIGASSGPYLNGVVVNMSTSPAGTFRIDNPSPFIGAVLQDVLADVSLQSAGPSLNVCAPANQFLVKYTYVGGGTVDFGVRFQEGFRTAWLPKVAQTRPSWPGASYASESGFYDPSLPAANNLNTLGLADTGTRLALHFSNVPSSARLYVTTTAIGTSGKVALNLIRSDGTPIVATTTAVWNGQTFPVAPVDPSTVEWEVSSADPTTYDWARVGVLLAYEGSLSQTPALRASYGPAETTSLIPRFVSTGSSVTIPYTSCIPGVDLLVTDVTGLPTYFGTTSKTRVTIANRGDAASGPFNLSVRLMNDVAPTSEEARLDVPVSGLAGGEVRDITFRFRPPLKAAMKVRPETIIDSSHTTADRDRTNNVFTAPAYNVNCGFAPKGNMAASALGGVYPLSDVASCMSWPLWLADEGNTWKETPWLTNTLPEYSVSVTPNNSVFRRSAVGSISGGWFQVQQASIDAGCTTTLASGDLSTAPATGTSRILSIQASAPTCKWTAVSNVKAAAPTADLQTGSQSITLKVRPNFSPTPRTIPVAAGTWGGLLQQAGNSRPLNERIVQLIYYYFLNRLPREDEITLQVNGMKGLDLEDFIQRFLTTEEFAINSRFVAGLYVGLLTRDPEFNGFQHQRDALTNSIATQEQLIANFLNSPEYALRFGTPSDVDYVKLLYSNVLLRTIPRPDEIDLQVNALKNGTSRVRLAGNFLNSPEFRITAGPRLTAFLLYNAAFGRDAAADELRYTQSELRGGRSPAELLEQFVGSAEFWGAIQ